MSVLDLFNLSSLIRRYGVSVFFETGTGSGSGFAYALNFNFEKVISSEIDLVRYNSLLQQFAPVLKEQPDRAYLFSGPSGKCLDDVLPQIPKNRKILYWLDAHFPGETTNSMDKYNFSKDISIPLVTELTIIQKHRKNCGDVIIFDDMRIFEKRNYEGKDLDTLGLSHLTDYDSMPKIRQILGDDYDIFNFDIDTGYGFCVPKQK